MFDFPVILKAQPEGGFVVYFPDVPEAITQGEDEAEAFGVVDEEVTAPVGPQDFLQTCAAKGRLGREADLAAVPDDRAFADKHDAPRGDLQTAVGPHVKERPPFRLQGGRDGSRLRCCLA